MVELDALVTMRCGIIYRMNDSPEKGHSTLVLVRGLPGSGKTYLAKALVKSIGEGSVVMLDPDATDYSSREYINHTKALTAEGVDSALHPYRFLRAKAYDAIASKEMVVWNQPFTNLEIFNKMVGRLRDHAAEHNVELNILVVEVEVDPVVARERVVSRKQQGGHGPSEATFNRFVHDYHSFAKHGYNTITVQGDDVRAAVSAVIARLNNG